MSTRAQLPHKIEKRRKDALERRMNDAHRYAVQSAELHGSEEGEVARVKTSSTLTEVFNLQKKLGLLKDTTE